MLSKIRQILTDKQHDLTAIFVSVSIALLLYFNFFDRYLMLPLQKFPDRSIGMAVMSGIDANLRTLHYCLTVFISIILILCLYVSLAWVNAWRSQLVRTVYYRAEQSMQFVLSLFSLFIICYAAVRGDLVILDIASTLLLFIGLLYYHTFIKIVLQRRSPALFSYFKDHSVSAFSLVLSFALLFAGWLISGDPLVFNRSGVIVFLLLNVVVITCWPVLLKWSGISPAGARSANLMAIIPLVLVPMMLPVSNELHYALSGSLRMQAQDLGRVIVALLFLASVALYVVFALKPRRFSTSFILRSIIFPLLITGFFMCNTVEGVLNFQDFDLFHNGERMLITQQILSFGRIPFVEIIPTHGIMDFFGQTLYSLVNGYRGPEMFLWRWIPVLAGVLLMYFMLTRFMSPLFTFLLILVTPEVFIFNDYYRFCIIIPLVLLWVMRRPDVRRYLVLWVVIVLLFFWRYDFGIIAAIATLCVVPGVFFVRYGEQLTVSSLLRSFKTALQALVIVFSLSTALYALVLLLNHQDPVEMLGQFYIYFKSQAPTQTILEVFDRYSSFFLLEYLVSPVISVLFIVFYLYFLLFRGVSFKPVQLLLVWLAIFGLVMTMRTIQRHTLFEGFNPVLSIFLLCAAPFYFKGMKKWPAHAFFIFTFLVYTMLLANMEKRLYVKIKPINLIPRGPMYNFYELPKKASRVMIGDSSQFKDLGKFCDTYLQKDQTFFDFSNAPLLYVFTNRLFPAHLIPNLYQAADPIEDFLVRRLEKMRKENRIPLVLFKQNSYWDSIDGVPQAVRSYRVAEFIYHNYLPFARVGPYEMWKEKGSQLTLDDQKVSSPGFIRNTGSSIKDVKIGTFGSDSISMHPFGTDPFLFNILDIGKGIPMDASKNLILTLKTSSNLNGNLQIFYSINGKPFREKLSSTLKIKGGSGTQEHSVFLPEFKAGSILTDLRFDPPVGTDFCIYRPVITEATYVPATNTDPQYFDLKKLPYIWANYDGKNASSKTEILEDHLIKDSIVGKHEDRCITLGSAIDKSSGNYLQLFIRAKEKGQVSLSYGSSRLSTILFDLEPTGKQEQYLVRISTQWAWMNDQVEKINISSTVPVTVSRMVVRKGD